MMFFFELTGTPISFKRASAGGRNPAKYTAYKNVIKIAARSHMNDLRMSSWGKSSVQILVEVTLSNFRGLGDTDNYAKTVADALEGVLYDNDRTIVDTRTVRVVGGDPGLRVWVKNVGPERSQPKPVDVELLETFFQVEDCFA